MKTVAPFEIGLVVADVDRVLQYPGAGAQIGPAMTFFGYLAAMQAAQDI